MSNIVRRAAGTPLSEEAREQLRALAAMPDSEINYSDIPERIYKASPELPLEEHTVTLRIDSEVAEWLETVKPEEAPRLNFLLKRAAQRSKMLPPDAVVLDKAS